VVRTERGDRMIPLVKEIVVSVDTERGVIVVDPPQGLLD
jgi:ribosomal 30S subunit maturation factor RimM